MALALVDLADQEHGFLVDHHAVLGRGSKQLLDILFYKQKIYIFLEKDLKTTETSRRQVLHSYFKYLAKSFLEVNGLRYFPYYGIKCFFEGTCFGTDLKSFGKPVETLTSSSELPSEQPIRGKL